jgi:hypothetical protein
MSDPGLLTDLAAWAADPALPPGNPLRAHAALLFREGFLKVSDLLAAADAGVPLPAWLEETVAFVRPCLPPEAGLLQSPAPRILGLAEDPGPADGLLRVWPWSAALLKLPEAVDLTPRLPPARDQGLRGSCVAFAATAAHEFARGGAGPALSEQWLYWCCKKHDGVPGPGTTAPTALDQLREAGQATAALWPYHPLQKRGNEGQGPPPRGARKDAATRKLAAAAVLPGDDLAQLKAALAGLEVRGVPLPGRVVLFGLPLYGSFFAGSVAKTGRVICPLPGELAHPRGGHAMVLTGFRDGPEPGGGVLKARNSWGSWGDAGSCTIPYRYFLEHGRGRSFYVLLDAREAAALDPCAASQPERRAAASPGPARTEAPRTAFPRAGAWAMALAGLGGWAWVLATPETALAPKAWLALLILASALLVVAGLERVLEAAD